MGQSLYHWLARLVINKFLCIASTCIQLEICRNMLLRLHKSQSLALTLNHIVGHKEATVPAVGFVLVLALLVVLGFLPLWVAISFHEGSTLLLVLNSLKLHQCRQNSPDFACIWVDEHGTLGACL
jgi:hypothetical protein